MIKGQFLIFTQIAKLGLILKMSKLNLEKSLLILDTVCCSVVISRLLKIIRLTRLKNLVQPFILPLPRVF